MQSARRAELMQCRGVLSNPAEMPLQGAENRPREPCGLWLDDVVDASAFRETESVLTNREPEFFLFVRDSIQADDATTIECDVRRSRTYDVSTELL